MGKHLDRRTFLMGAGAALALPMLDAMTPAFAKTSSRPPLRMAFTYVPNGVIGAEWTPTGEGPEFERYEIDFDVEKPGGVSIWIPITRPA